MRCLQSSIGKCYHVLLGNVAAAADAAVVLLAMSRVNLPVSNFDSMVSRSLPCKFHNSHHASDSFDYSGKVIIADDARADKWSLLFRDSAMMIAM